MQASRCQLIDRTASTETITELCQYRPLLLGPPTPGLAPLREDVNTTGSALHQRHPRRWRWQGHNVVLVDGTTVLMPDTEANQNVFPQQSSQKPGLGFPIAPMGGLISLAAGSIIDYIAGPYQGKGSGESSLFSQLIETLRPSDLLLADRYYCTYAIIALLMQKGVNVLFQNYARENRISVVGRNSASKTILSSGTSQSENRFGCQDRITMPCHNALKSVSYGFRASSTSPP